jgi:CheY-like chemotaxis protein
MSRTILLADDSVTIQKVIELTFMEENYQVIAVSSGDDALDKLAEATPDLVIADIHMPGSSGYEVCRRSKQLHPRVPVILLVGTFEPFDEAEAAACGADANLKKPFDSQELLELVGELIGSPSAVAAAAPPPAPEAVGSGWAAPASPAGFGAGREDPFPLSIDEPAAPAAALAEGDEVFRFAFEREAPEAFAEPELEPAPRRAAEPPPAEGEAEGFGDDLLLVDDSPFAPEEVDEGEPFRIGVDDEEPEAPAPSPFLEEVAAVGGDDVEDPRGPAPSPGEVEPAAPATGRLGPLSDEDVDRIARRVAEVLGERVVREVAWEVIPDLAEVVIKDRLRELEGQID